MSGKRSPFYYFGQAGNIFKLRIDFLLNIRPKQVYSGPVWYEQVTDHVNTISVWLSPLPLFVSFSVSKQQAIMLGQSYTLDDGSNSFKDFHGSRNNRFNSPEQAAKNRIQHPSNVLHFFNAQPEATPEIFSQVGLMYLGVWT